MCGDKKLLLVALMTGLLGFLACAFIYYEGRTAANGYYTFR